ncbi:hypothetical protein EDD25_2291 [Cryobacterium psychrophilum]|nr:hypothetical protein EDD25_2291 [Cryobacterium psychrophilum]
MSCSVCASAAMIVNSIEPIGVEVSTSPPAEVQYAKARAALAQPVSEIEHVLRRSAEPIEGRYEKRVAFFERVESEIKAWPRCTSTRSAVVDVEVVATDACG